MELDLSMQIIIQSEHCVKQSNFNSEKFNKKVL